VFRYGENVPTENREENRNRENPVQGREDLSRNLQEAR